MDTIKKYILNESLRLTATYYYTLLEQGTLIAIENTQPDDWEKVSNRAANSGIYTFLVLNNLEELCDSCVYKAYTDNQDKRFSEIIDASMYAFRTPSNQGETNNGVLASLNPNPNDNSLTVPFNRERDRSPRSVTANEMQCRLCQRERNIPALESFKNSLKVRRALLKTSDRPIGGFSAPDLSSRSVGHQIFINGSQKKLMFSFSGGDDNITPKTLTQEEAVSAIKENMAQENIAGINNVDDIIMGTEQSSPVFKTLKATSNDAEMKILESTTTLYRKTSDQNLKMALKPDNIEVKSDRMTCEFCRETGFRANSTLQNNIGYVFPISNPANPSTHLKSILYKSGPLYAREKIMERRDGEASDSEVSKVIAFIEKYQGNSQLCQ